ncbi:uncharacterized protein LOC144921888 isoform X1 [Branchiostoma floridae x Branchiostoma belcheri]
MQGYAISPCIKNYLMNLAPDNNFQKGYAFFSHCSRADAKARTTKQARSGIQTAVPNRGKRQEATSDDRPCQQRSTPHVFNDEQWSFTERQRRFCAPPCCLLYLPCLSGSISLCRRSNMETTTCLQEVLQMGLIRPLTRRYKDFPLMMLSSLVLTTSYVIATCMTERWHIYVFAVFKSFGVIMTNTVVVSALSKASPREDTGAVMGLLAMFVSLGKVVSPPISTYVLDHVGYQFLGVTSAAMTTVVAGFIRLTKEEFR